MRDSLSSPYAEEMDKLVSENPDGTAACGGEVCRLAGSQGERNILVRDGVAYLCALMPSWFGQMGQWMPVRNGLRTTY